MRGCCSDERIPSSRCKAKRASGSSTGTIFTAILMMEPSRDRICPRLTIPWLPRPSLPFLPLIMSIASLSSSATLLLLSPTSSFAILSLRCPTTPSVVRALVSISSTCSSRSPNLSFRAVKKSICHLLFSLRLSSDVWCFSASSCSALSVIVCSVFQRTCKTPRTSSTTRPFSSVSAKRVCTSWAMMPASKVPPRPLSSFHSKSFTRSWPNFSR
mmetsp:Transcript_40445/g.81586  ORF Transcript_40445/g.81586 Transcript_40445/m.81586 type:complete len:214 (+) Transcript_40445:45-686(+)